MAVSIANVETTDTFNTWLNTTNQLATHVANTISVGGETPTGDAALTGNLSIVGLVANSITAATANVTIASNTTFNANQVMNGSTSTFNSNATFSANATFSGNRVVLGSIPTSIGSGQVQVTSSASGNERYVAIDPTTKLLYAATIEEKLSANNLSDVANTSGSPVSNSALAYNTDTSSYNDFSFTTLVTQGALGQHINATSLDVASANVGSVKIEDLTSGRVTLAGTGGELEDNANFTFNGTTLSVGSSFSVTNATGVIATGGISSSNLTSGRVVLATTSGALNDSSSLTFDGTTLTTSNISTSNITSTNTDFTTLRASSLTNTSIPYIGDSSGKFYSSNSLKYTGTEIQFNANLSVNTSTFFVDIELDRVGIKTASPSADLHVNGDALVSGNLTIDTDTLFVDTVGDEVGINTASPEAALHVDGDALVTGDLTTGYTSDERLKENISTIDNSLNILSSINGVRFNWIEGIDKNFSQYISPKEGEDIGVIAQEVEKVLPEVVRTYPDGYKGVDYAKFVPVLLEAIKHLNNRVEQLENQVNSNGNKG